MGRPVVEGVDVGQQHERVGVDEVRHERGQPVVVTEPDLVGRDGVVLVDDGHHPEGQQPFERPAGVGVVGSPGDIVRGEQDLADGEIVGAERMLVRGDEGSLADAGRRLLGGEVAGAADEAERGQARGDRP